MIFTTINTGSIGNSYFLKSTKGEILFIDCGVRFSEVKKALNFDLSGSVGCLLGHQHMDHLGYAKEFINAGIDVYTNDECAEFSKIKSHRLHVVYENKVFKLGSFTVMPFELKHDVKNFGYLIHHPECGTTVYITDTYYVPTTFKGLNNIIIEANFDQEIIDQKLKIDKKFLRDRILKSHLSIEHCLNVLRANDLTAVNNICLIHLSESNSNEQKFKQLVENQTGKNVHVARKNMVIEFNKTPF